MIKQQAEAQRQFELSVSPKRIVGLRPDEVAGRLWILRESFSIP